MAKKKPGRPKARKPPPRCKAILFCHGTIVEAMTGNVTIIGTFDGFVQLQFPGLTRPFTVFLQLTNGIGRYRTTIEVHNLRDGSVLARAEGTIEFSDRRQKQNVMIPVPPLPLPHPGVYDIVVLADNQEIDRQQFRAVSAEDLTNDDDNEEERDQGNEGNS